MSSVSIFKERNMYIGIHVKTQYINESSSSAFESLYYLEACTDITGIHSPIVIMYIHSNVAKFVSWY